MELLWAEGEATVRSVAERLPGGKRPAYTTVMTVMARLADKGLLVRSPSGRAYVYRPAKTREEYLAGASQARVRELVKDYGEVALVHFVEEIEKADPHRLDRLSSLLRQRGRR